MQLTPSLLALLQLFTPVFTTPTFTTFVQIVTGWIFSQASPLHPHRNHPIFSGGNVGNETLVAVPPLPSSHASWNLDAFALRLAKLVVSRVHRARAPCSSGPSMTRSIDDAGADPLPRRPACTTIHSSPAAQKPLVSWEGMIRSILCIHRPPVLGPTKVFALPGGGGSTATDRGSRRARRARPKPRKAQGRPQPPHPPETGRRTHQTGGGMGLPRISLSSPAIAPTAARACSPTCPRTFISSVTSIPRGRSTNRRRRPHRRPSPRGGRTRKGPGSPALAAWAEDPGRPWTELKFHQFHGLHATLAVQGDPSPVLQVQGDDRLLAGRPQRSATSKGKRARSDTLHPAGLGRAT